MNTNECECEMMSAILEKYKKIHDNLATIVNAYEELIMLDCNYEEINDLTLTKNSYKTTKTHVLRKINELEGVTYKQLQCKHNFIDDHIDIDPDRSQKITYCTLCEYTPPV
jgi:hypothetical protein